MGLEPIDEVFDRLGFGKFQLRSIIIVGVVNSVEPLMMTLLTIIGSELQCEWQLNPRKVGYMSTAFVIGNAVGNIFWGILSIKINRLLTYCVAYTTTVYFLFLLAFVPNYSWILFLLAVCGFFVGGVVPAGFATVTEFNTSSSKAKGTVLMFIFWALGTLFTGLAPLVAKFHWTILILLDILVYSFFIGLLRFLPYSPRQLLYRGDHAMANKIIANIAEQNGKVELLSGLLPVQINYQSRRSEIGRIFNRKKCEVSAYLLILWTLTFFNFYGAVIMSTDLPRKYRGCLQFSFAEPSLFYITPEVNCCSGLDRSAYIILVLVALGELLGLAIDAFLLDYAGRKSTMFLFALVGALSYVCLSLCTSVFVTTAFLIVSRAAGIGIFAALVVYTGELYPTAIVTMAMGVFCCAGHIGAAVSPFIGVSILASLNPVAAMSTYAGVYLLVGALVLFLPVETLTNARKHNDPEQYEFDWLPDNDGDQTVHLIGN